MPPSHIPIAARLEGARRQRASLGFNAIIHGSRPGSATSAGGAMRSPLKATYALRNGERLGGSGAREQAREHRAVLGIARASVSQAFAHCPPLPGNAALPAACNPSLRHADCLQYRHTRLQKTTWATTALSKGATLLTSERSTLTSLRHTSVGLRRRSRSSGSSTAMRRSRSGSWRRPRLRLRQLWSRLCAPRLVRYLSPQTGTAMVCCRGAR